MLPAGKRTMPPARKYRRRCAPAVPELPVCLLLEIAARTDAATIFRCAATCKLLRREILSAGFVRRVCQGPGAVVPSRTLGVLGAGGSGAFSVVHPRTAATAALERHYLSPFMSRGGGVAAAGLLEQSYVLQTSRNGLVVLRRRGRSRRTELEDRLCVYDPMTKSRVFLPSPPDIGRRDRRRLPPGGGVAVIDDCALLTAADGIGCSFMLLAADMGRNLDHTSKRIRVQTLSSSSSVAGAGGDGGGAKLGRWSPVKTCADHHPCPWWCIMSLRSDSKGTGNGAPVVVGGVVHWLLHVDFATVKLFVEDDVGEHILTYDVSAAAVGSVALPEDRRRPILPPWSSQLASSPDGKLSFVATEQWCDYHCMVYVWVLSSSEGEGGSWARHVAIDMMAELGLKPGVYDFELLDFGDQRSGAVLFLFEGVFVVLDMETGATYVPGRREKTGIPYQVDLASRLASMKSF